MSLSDCQLALYLRATGISWSVLDIVHHKVMSLANFPFEKEQHLAEAWNEAAKRMLENDFGNRFGKVKITLDAGQNMLIPQELFIESELNVYAGFGLSMEEQPVKDFIFGIPAYNVYCIPNGLLESAKKVFEKFETFHSSTVFISNILRENKSIREIRIFACLSGNLLQIAALNTGKIIFFNSFSIRTKEDFSYYLMAVTEELSLNPELAAVYLSGDITDDSLYYHTTERFLKNLHFSDRPKALKYSPKLDSVPFHSHSLLYGIHLCE